MLLKKEGFNFINECLLNDLMIVSALKFHLKTFILYYFQTYNKTNKINSRNLFKAFNLHTQMLVDTFNINCSLAINCKKELYGMVLYVS